MFKDHLFHALDDKLIETAYVETVKHCLLKCVKNRQCFSTNFGVTLRDDGKVLCELLSSDKYNSSGSFQQSSSFHHFSILDQDWKFFNSSCFKYYSQPLNWQSAKAKCEQEGAMLAVFHSRDENDFMPTNVAPESFIAWIGLSDLETEHIFKWLDGSKLTFEQWFSGQPNGIGQRCVELGNGLHRGHLWTNQWNDQWCSDPFPFICKKKARMENN
ncbi:hypothetical protein ACROYT_G025018 [Oculina patagonica]